MSVDEEIELIETTISYLESAISELRECEYFSYKIDSFEDDIREMQEKLDELEQKQSNEWKIEIKQLEHEYWQDQF